MFGVNRPGIWIAFGLSVVFHVAGFELATGLPREPLSFTPPLVKSSIRLIKPTAQLGLNTAQPTIVKPEPNNQSAEASNLPISVPIHSKVAKEKPAEPEKLNAESIFLKQVHYFDSSEVDTNSELLEEWVIRTQGVQSTAIVAIQLTLYINENGRVDKFVVLNSSLSEAETALLLKDLALTAFKPALKDEKPVPSQKNVEIVLDPNPAVFRMPSFLNNFLPANK